jgi:hypothetical protein
MELLIQWEKWINLNEDRIQTLSINEFVYLYETYTHINKNNKKMLYKTIYNPTFKMGIFKRERKKLEILDEKDIKDFRFCKKNFIPTFNDSLVCELYTNEQINNNIKTFIVFPFKNSLFAIKDTNNNKLNKAYWKDKIQWLNNIKENMLLWTDSNCLLIEKELYDKLKNKLKV